MFRSQGMWWVAQSLVGCVMAQGANRATAETMLDWVARAQAIIDIDNGCSSCQNTHAGLRGLSNMASLTNFRKCKETTE